MGNAIFWFFMAFLSALFAFRSSDKVSDVACDDADWTVSKISFVIGGTIGVLLLGLLCLISLGLASVYLQ